MRWLAFSRWRSQIDGNLLELLTGSTVALVLKVIGAGLAFLFNVVIARNLGPNGAGIYFLASSSITIAVVFGRLGLDKTVLRYVAANVKGENWSAVKGIQQKALTIGVSAGGLATFAVIVLSPTLSVTVFDKPELLVPLRWMSLAIVPMTINFIFAHLLKGMKSIFRATLIENVGVSGVALAAFYLVGRYFSIPGAAGSYVLGAVVTASMAIILWRNVTPELRRVSAKFDTDTILKSSMPLFWVALTTWTISHFGEFALGIWSTSAEVGVFGVATRTATFISFALMAVNSIAAPQFAALYQHGTKKELAKAARNAMTLTALAAIVPTLACVVAPTQIMSVFGQDFIDGSAVLMILALAQFVNAATGPVELLLMMSGKERLVRTNVMAVGILNVLLCVSLIPSYGAVGAALAFAVGLVTRNIISVWLVGHALNIDLYGHFGRSLAKRPADR